MKPRVRLTTEGRYWLAATGLLWLVGLLKGINLILLLAYILLALWALNWFAVRRSAKSFLAARRGLPVAFAGDTVTWELTVMPIGKPILGAAVSDAIGDDTLTWGGLLLRPGEPTRLRRRWPVGSRGARKLGPVVVRTAYPFGLFERSIECETGDEWVVLPRIGTIHMDRLVRWMQSSGRPNERQRRARRAIAEPTDTAGLRDFRPGDSPRWIHWKTTARRNELVVREFDQAACRELTLVVETAGPAEIVEQALSLAATIVWEWPKQSGGRLKLVIVGDEVRRFDHAAAVGPYWPLLEQLGRAEVVTRLTDRKLGDSANPGGLLVISNRATAADDYGRYAAVIHPTSPPDFYRPARTR